MKILIAERQPTSYYFKIVVKPSDPNIKGSSAIFEEFYWGLDTNLDLALVEMKRQIAAKYNIKQPEKLQSEGQDL